MTMLSILGQGCCLSRTLKCPIVQPGSTGTSRMESRSIKRGINRGNNGIPNGSQIRMGCHGMSTGKGSGQGNIQENGGGIMDAIARHRWRMRVREYVTWGNTALMALLVVEILWIWFLWRICVVVLDILAWGGEIP